jgi:hypothetical protein
VLAAALVLQLADLRPPHAERRVTSRSADFHSWQNPLPSDVWHLVLPHYDHLVLVPARQCGNPPLAFDAPAYLAGMHGLTLNSGEVARFNEDRRQAYCARLENDIAGGQADDRSFYILDAAHADSLRRAANNRVVCGTIDGVHVCVTADSYAPWRRLAALN